MSDAVDERLLAARDLALAALREVTPEHTIGAPAGHVAEGDGVVSLRFETTMPGYPGWYWTVSVAAVGDAAPTVLEVELLPGEGALLAPEWVPWSVRLEEYKAAQAADARDDDGGSDDEAEDVDGEDLDADDLDADDFDEDGSPLLHSGDIDGVDVDAADEGAEEEDGDDESAEEDGDDEDDDEGVDDDSDGSDDAEDEADR